MTSGDWPHAPPGSREGPVRLNLRLLPRIDAYGNLGRLPCRRLLGGRRRRWGRRRLLPLIGDGRGIGLLRGFNAARRHQPHGAEAVRQVAKLPLRAEHPHHRHEEAQGEEEGEHDRDADQDRHLREEVKEAEEHDETGGGRGDGAGENRRSHVPDGELGAFLPRGQAVVPSLAIDVRQVHDVVDRVADDDDTGDGLADTQVPVHGGLAEAEHAEHDGGHGNHGVARHHEIPRRGEDDEEGDRHRDAAALE
mmetsp:Transcript_72651/g.210310  ORF Transcript_72651/g.210310 Transcript_72651/m.210310 type:complete len:250 (-) Transcript_72651:2146-2895(-)